MSMILYFLKNNLQVSKLIGKCPVEANSTYLSLAFISLLQKTVLFQVPPPSWKPPKEIRLTVMTP